LFLSELKELRAQVIDSTKRTPLLLNKGMDEKHIFREFVINYYGPILKELD
jgi:hypothetical protein